LLYGGRNQEPLFKPLRVCLSRWERLILTILLFDTRFRRTYIV
jgi:hypothetical protein